MAAINVNQLGYLGLDVSDLPRWEEFATRVLGLQATGGEDGARFLRMDENHHRFALHAGAADDIAYAGWEVQDEAALRSIAAHLEAQGAAVAWGTPAEARARHVIDLIKVRDPDGVAIEIYYGPLVEYDRPFRSNRAIGGFETGDLGLGHIVLAVDDYEASLRFYRDGLGLKISDFMELEMDAGKPTTVAFFHCGPRHHSIAIAQYSAPKHLHHFMLQVKNMDDVGATYDLCLERGVPITSTLGRHTNDHMLSFYLRTPSGFSVEYGYGGRVINDNTWEVQRHRAASIWGHQPSAVAATSAVS